MRRRQFHHGFAGLDLEDCLLGGDLELSCQWPVIGTTALYGELYSATNLDRGGDPADLPSPVLAGAASLAAFSAGALVPLLPFLLGLPRLAATLVITAVALAVGGTVVGRITGRSLLRSGLRQLALGGLAIAVTFAVGSLIGGHPH